METSRGSLQETRAPSSPALMTLEDIYAAHAGFVWRTLRRLGVGENDADDALQEVFLAVHRTLASFEGRSSMKTWLFALCRSAARDRRRRAHVRHEVASESLLAEVPEPSKDALAQAEAREKLKVLEEILATMDDGEREVFLLFELEEMTGPETAETLSLPLGTAYTRLRSAREAFRRALSARRGAP